MGLSSSSTASEDVPWILGLRDVGDYLKGVTAEERMRLRQKRMPVEILPHLYLSSASAADPKILRLRRVTHAINAAGRAARSQAAVLRKTMTVLEFEGHDIEGFPMLPRYFARTRQFVQTAQAQGGKVVIFCVAGINRSAVLCAAEYMVSQRVNVIDAVRHCRRCKGNVFLTNHSFQAQLVALARKERLLGPPPCISSGTHEEEEEEEPQTPRMLL